MSMKAILLLTFILKDLVDINIDINFDAGTNAHMAAISVAAIRVFGGIAAIFLMKRVPRLHFS